MTRTRSERGGGRHQPGHLDEGTLLVRHCSGDAAAFAEFITRYRRVVYSYLVRCGVENGVRDDLFQEIFAKVHAAAASYQPDRALRPWVLAIAANTVRSHYRKERVRDLVPVEPLPAARDTVAPDSEQLIEARETAAWVEQVIAGLPFSQREVVVLCCVEQLPQADVAAALGMPVNTVKTHLRRARLALAQALARRRAALRREVSR